MMHPSSISLIYGIEKCNKKSWKKPQTYIYIFLFCYFCNFYNPGSKNRKKVAAKKREDDATYLLSLWRAETLSGRRTDRKDNYPVPTLPPLFYSLKLLGAAVSLFNLGQTDGDSVFWWLHYHTQPQRGQQFLEKGLERPLRLEEETMEWRTKAWISMIFLIIFSDRPLSPPSPHTCWLLTAFVSLPVATASSLFYLSPKMAAGWPEQPCSVKYWQINRRESRRFRAQFSFFPDRTQRKIHHRAFPHLNTRTPGKSGR